jgi:hypothetical protein
VSESRQILGLELAGAKSQKTSLAVLEFYPKEKKVFLLDVYDKILADDEESGDQALLDTLREVISSKKSSEAILGVNVPLTLPPCIGCKLLCPMPKKCSVPAVKWMRDQVSRATVEDSEIRVREFLPYTQRPFEIWARYRLLPRLAKEARFEIDETLGGNRAPLTARMQFLKRHLKPFRLVEVLPKLTVAALCTELKLSRRLYQNYRKPEEGLEARTTILEHICDEHEIFIYDRDLKKLALSLTAFDAFICAYTALFADQDRTVKPPRGFPKESGWVEYPDGGVLK